MIPKLIITREECLKRTKKLKYALTEYMDRSDIKIIDDYAASFILQEVTQEEEYEDIFIKTRFNIYSMVHVAAQIKNNKYIATKLKPDEYEASPIMHIKLEDRVLMLE